MRVDVAGWKDLARQVNRLAVDLPGLRGAALESFYDDVKGALDAQYYDLPASTDQPLPPAFSGSWRASTRIWVQPQLGAMSVRNMAAHSTWMETGRDPGSVPTPVIAAWALKKLGVDNVRIVRAIARKIRRRGWSAMHTMEKATSPSMGGAGIALHAAIGQRLTIWIRELGPKYGMGG